MQLNPSLLDSVRGESKNRKRGCRCIWGSRGRRAKGEGSQEGEEITTESSGGGGGHSAQGWGGDPSGRDGGDLGTLTSEAGGRERAHSVGSSELKAEGW